MFRLPLVSALILFSQLPLAALAADPEIFHLRAEDEKEWGYAQAVRVGDTLYLSGTTGRGESMADQVRNAYERIRRTLEHFGADVTDVVRETVFTTDMEALKAASGTRKEFYKGHTPASSWIGIDRLFVPGILVEIEVTAVLDDEPAD